MKETSNTDESDGWISVKNRLPDKDGIYLCILKSPSKSNHAKRWGGMGKPEICSFYRGWDYPWSARGTLVVAYWRPLPKFNKKWNPKSNGESGEWE